MSKIQKLVNELMINPTRLRYAQIEKILLYYGFTKHQAKGSHIKFKHKSLRYDLVISLHHNDCLDYYKKLTRDHIKQLSQFYL